MENIFEMDIELNGIIVTKYADKKEDYFMLKLSNKLTTYFGSKMIGITIGDIDFDN